MREQIQKEALESIEKFNGHCLLNLAPRVGKTKIAIDYLKKHPEYNKILWVAPSVEMRDTDVPNEFIKWKAKTIFNKVTVVQWASLNKENCKKYDCVILDEYHLITPNNSKTLSGKILGLSGTHPVEEDKLELLKKLNLKICYSLSIDKAVKYNIVAPYQINIIEYNLDNKVRNIEAGNKFKTFKTTELEHYNFLTKRINAMQYSGKPVPAFMYINRQRALHTYPSRMQIAKDIVKRLKGRSLIFTYQIDQAEELCKHTYHSKTDELDYKHFQEGKLDKLALVNMASVGTTFHNMDNCLIVGTNSKAKNFEQKFCRILIPRENYIAKVFILCALNTQDEKWVKTAVANLDSSNINYINYKNVVNQEKYLFK